MKKIKIAASLLALLLVVSFILSACGSEADNKETNSGNKFKLTFTWWGSNSRNEATMKAINLWNKAHPDIEVVPNIVPGEGYSDKLTMQTAANSAPDLIQLTEDGVKSLAILGQLLDLSKYKDKYFSKIDKNTWNSLSYPFDSTAKPYGVCTGLDASCWIYDKNLLDKYGVRYPTDNETVDSMFELEKEFESAVIKKDGKADVWATTDIMDNSAAGYSEYLVSQGYPNGLWTPDFKGCVLNDTKIVSCLKQMERYKNAGVVVPLNTEVPEFRDYVSAGIVAFQQISISSYSMYKSIPGSDFRFFMEPKPTVDTRHCSSVTPIAIYSKTKYPEQAAKFLSWLTTSAKAAKTMGMIRGVFASKTQRDAVYSSLSQPEKVVVDYIKKVQHLGVTVAIPTPKHYPEFNDIFLSEKSIFINGRQTFEQMCSNIYKSANSLLNLY